MALLAAWFSSSSLCCVQAQVTQKSDNSSESQPLLNYYIRMVQRMGEGGECGHKSPCVVTLVVQVNSFCLVPKSTLIAVVTIPASAAQDFV